MARPVGVDGGALDLDAGDPVLAEQPDRAGRRSAAAAGSGRARARGRPSRAGRPGCGRRCGRRRPLLGGRVELQVGGVDQHGRAVQLAELAQLLGGEGGLRRAAPAEHGDLLDRGGGERVEHVLRHVGRLELGGRPGQHPGDVERDVADARRRRPTARRPAPPRPAPGRRRGGRVYQATRSVAARLPGRSSPSMPEVAVEGGAVGVDDGVDVPAQLLQRDVPADLDVADEAHQRVVEGAVQGVADGPHLRVVGRDAVPDQAERRGQPVDQVDGDRDVVLPGQRVGGVDAGRPGADDGHPQRTAADGGAGEPSSRHDWHPDPTGAAAPDQRARSVPITRPQEALVSVVVVATITPQARSRSTPSGRRSWPPSRRCTTSPAASSTPCTRARASS